MLFYRLVLHVGESETHNLLRPVHKCICEICPRNVSTSQIAPAAWHRCIMKPCNIGVRHTLNRLHSASALTTECTSPWVLVLNLARTAHTICRVQRAWLCFHLVSTARCRFAFFRLASFSTARSMRTSLRLAFCIGQSMGSQWTRWKCLQDKGYSTADRFGL